MPFVLRFRLPCKVTNPKEGTLIMTDMVTEPPNPKPYTLILIDMVTGPLSPKPL